MTILDAKIAVEELVDSGTFPLAPPRVVVVNEIVFVSAAVECAVVSSLPPPVAVDFVVTSALPPPGACVVNGVVVTGSVLSSSYCRLQSSDELQHFKEHELNEEQSRHLVSR